MRILDLTKAFPDFDAHIWSLTLQAKVGKHCFVHPYKSGYILKIFHSYPLKNFDHLEDAMWGDPPAVVGYPNMSVPLTDATKIQNICWMYGISPRVYEIVGIKIKDKKYWAQLQDDAGEGFSDTHMHAQPIYEIAKKIGELHGFHNDKDDVSMWDVVNGKLVDFNTFHFSKDHIAKTQGVYEKMGNYGKTYYHPVEEIDIVKSPRNNNARVKWMGLDKIDFNGKSVLDIGCAGGWFSRYAKKHGAEYVLGLDWPDVKGSDPVMASYIAANELMMWDIDFENVNLLEEKIVEKFDIVFFFSMSFHVGVLEWLADATKGLCVVEDNSRKKDADTELKKLFKRVEYIGESTDRGEREGHGLKIYHCKN